MSAVMPRSSHRTGHHQLQQGTDGCGTRGPTSAKYRTRSGHGHRPVVHHSHSKCLHASGMTSYRSSVEVCITREASVLLAVDDDGHARARCSDQLHIQAGHRADRKGAHDAPKREACHAYIDGCEYVRATREQQGLTTDRGTGQPRGRMRAMVPCQYVDPYDNIVLF